MNTQKNTFKKTAFTLAEVLVTLTVIGIIAAIVVPAVNSNAPKQNKVMLRKAYVTLQKIVDSLINDDFLYPSFQKFAIKPNVYLSKGFNYIDDPTNESLQGGTTYFNKFCYHLAKNIDLVGAQTCPYTTDVTTVKLFGSSTDGMNWYIYTGGTANQFRTDNVSYVTKIIVDVNGARKPNCTADTLDATLYPATHAAASGAACTNPDTFIFGIRYDGKIRSGNASSNDAVTATTDAKAVEYLSSPLESR